MCEKLKGKACNVMGSIYFVAIVLLPEYHYPVRKHFYQALKCCSATDEVSMAYFSWNRPHFFVCHVLSLILLCLVSDEDIT